MCGIAGIVDFNGRTIDSRNVMRMCDALKHRGPDDEGFYENSVYEKYIENVSVAFGHRRLSVIDLETGHQPMSNEDGTVHIVYNGEIYNFTELKKELAVKGYAFKTHSDTEVIIRAYEEYGEECVKYFNGMFAFALWDSRKEKLILAKDHLGKKPLYYYFSERRVVFASELQALIKEGSVPRAINYDAIDKYLRYLCIPAPDTIYMSVKKIEPAHILVFEKGKLRQTGYWHIDFRNKIQISAADAVRGTAERIEQAVKMRLVSDVPLGVLLSGGVDSSAVVAFMAKVSGEKIKTFSIGFKESRFNELPYARLIAERYDTDHHEFIVEPHIKVLLPKLVRHYGEPYADSSAIPTYYVTQMAAQHVKVALNGDGGDEVFIGYKQHLANLIAERFSLFGKIAQMRPLSGIFGYMTRGVSYTSGLGRMRRFLEAAGLPRGERYARWVTFYNDEMKSNLYKENFKERLLGGTEDALLKVFRENADLPVIEASLLADITVNLPSDLIVKMDIASMANSLETRSPFLDKDLMEFVASLPVGVKMKNFTLKYLLKEILKEMVPGENLHRQKKGFAVPIGEWFKGELKEDLSEVIFSPRARIAEFFNMEYVRNMAKMHMEGTRDYPHHLWILYMLELWFREEDF